MNSFRARGREQSIKRCSRSNNKMVWAALLLALCLGMTLNGQAQVSASAEKGGPLLSVGGTFSGYYVGYGERKMLGPSVFIDLGSRSPFSLEGEARWINLRQTADVHDETYLAGPRFSFPTIGRFTPYAKVLVGDGEFHFPYNYAHGSYLVVAPGAGVDFHLHKRIYWRVVDFQYQYWNQFTFGSMPSYGVSSGIRVRIF